MITSPALAAGVAHTIIVSAKAIHLYDREKNTGVTFSCLIIDSRTNGSNSFKGGGLPSGFGCGSFCY